MTQSKWRMTLLMWQTESSVLVNDEKGKMFQVFRLDRSEFKVRTKISPLTCWHNECLCHKKLRRPHLTCFPCRLRKVVSGELPPVIEVMPYIVLFRRKRSLLINHLGKILCTLVEQTS
jgi:hypothetical protein